MNKKYDFSCIKHLIFDLGGVLFYDELVVQCYYFNVYSKLTEFSNISEEFFFEKRKLMYKKHGDNWVKLLLKDLVGNIQTTKIISFAWQQVLNNFSNLFIPYPQIHNFLKKLEKKYTLFIVANQPKEALCVLKNLNLEKYFQEIYIDAFEGVSKPEITIFQKLLDKNCISPNSIAVIGDRLDNDIIPAKKLGMLAVKLSIKPKKFNVSQINNSFSSICFKNLSQNWHRLNTADIGYYTFYSHKELQKALLTI